MASALPRPASTGSLSSGSDRCQLEVKSGGYRTAGSCAEFVATVPERTPTSDCTGQYMTALEPLDWDRLVLASASALFPASDIAFERRGRRQTIDPSAPPHPFRAARRRAVRAVWRRSLVVSCHLSAASLWWSVAARADDTPSETPPVGTRALPAARWVPLISLSIRNTHFTRGLASTAIASCFAPAQSAPIGSRCARGRTADALRGLGFRGKGLRGLRVS